MVRRPIVVLESPYKNPNVMEHALNRLYSQRCLRDSIERGEAPFASHVLYTRPGVLNDDDPCERATGIDTGLAFLSVADLHVFYVNRGMSPGMEYALAHHVKHFRRVPIVFRELD